MLEAYSRVKRFQVMIKLGKLHIVRQGTQFHLEGEKKIQWDMVVGRNTIDHLKRVQKANDKILRYDILFHVLNLKM